MDNIYGSRAAIDSQTQTQKTTLGQDALATIIYNAQHEPIQVQDGSGSISALTYNEKGQPLTLKMRLFKKQ